MKSLSIVFAGTPEFGVPCLEALAQSEHCLRAVFTQPDRPAGRGQKLQLSAVKQWAVQHAIPVYQPLNFKSSDDVEALRALKPDVMIVIAYGLILPQSVLAIPRYGCINVHASLLPRWRGASPIQQAILHGDNKSGVTIMQMDKGMDTGDMLSVSECEITPDETSDTLHDKLSRLSVTPLLACLQQLATDGLSPQKQPVDGITYAAKISKADALINWQQDAKQIDCQIRAFNPWPIAYALLDNEPLRVHRAEYLSLSHNQQPGSVLSFDKKGLVIAAGIGAINIQQVQFPGGNKITIADCLNGKRFERLQRGFL